MFKPMWQYLIPRFIASDTPIMEMANSMLLQILAAWKWTEDYANFLDQK